jgi:hypothetical protein
MKYLIVSIMVFFIASCAGHKCEYDSEEWREYKLVSLDKPKHFYVDLKDVQTGKLYYHVYVSKHCNSWKNLKIGGTYKLKRVHWTDGGHENSDFDKLYDCLCK